VNGSGVRTDRGACDGGTTTPPPGPGAGSMTAPDATVGGARFAETIRSINGSPECNGNNTAEMRDRVNRYLRFAAAPGADPGGANTC
jgi:hypothetical protein